MLSWSDRSGRFADVVAYLLTVAIAIASSWGAADLMWGLWITALIGTIPTIAAPWLLLTWRPDLEGSGRAGQDPDGPGRKHTRGEWKQSLIILSVFWGTAVGGYLMAALLIVNRIPLPTTGSAEAPGVIGALVVSSAAYWQMIAVNVVNQSWQVWHAIRAGTGSPTNPMVGVGRVLVAGTVMGGLYLFRIDSVLVALLLFLFYVPDDVFAERVLGMG